MRSQPCQGRILGFRVCLSNGGVSGLQTVDTNCVEHKLRTPSVPAVSNSSTVRTGAVSCCCSKTSRAKVSVLRTPYRVDKIGQALTTRVGTEA